MYRTLSRDYRNATIDVPLYTPMNTVAGNSFGYNGQLSYAIPYRPKGSGCC